MANVYSKMFWRVANGAVLTPILGPLVPAGFVWDVRDVYAYNPTIAGIPLYGFVIGDGHAGLVAGASYPDVIPGRPVHIEVRQILSSSSSDRLTLTSNDVGWRLRICGYELALP